MSDDSFPSPLFFVLRNPWPHGVPRRIKWDEIAEIRSSTDERAVCVFASKSGADLYVDARPNRAPGWKVISVQVANRLLTHCKNSGVEFVAFDPSPYPDAQIYTTPIDEVLSAVAEYSQKEQFTLFFSPITFTYSEECLGMMERFSISQELVAETVNCRQTELFGTGRLLALRWQDDGTVVLVDSTISKMSADGSTIRVVSPVIVLRLREQLPAGRFDRMTDAETILALSAESFGEPLRCHADSPWSTLYSGPLGPDGIVEPKTQWTSGVWHYCGSFEKGWASMVWCCNFTKYSEWQASQADPAPKPTA